MFKVFVSTLFLSVSLLAGEIHVAVAANLSDTIEELKAEFAKTNPQTKVNTILGGSGKLATQIKAGAPFDLFLSADMKFPQSLYDEQFAITPPVVYASGALAMMSTKGFDLSQGMAILKDSNVEKIAVANPKTAPYGMASIEALKHANIFEKIESKLVYGESISQAIQFATTAADIGFVNTSAFYGQNMKKYTKGKEWVEVDPKLYTPIAQGIVILKKAQNNAEAKAFYTFILSPKAKDIFKHYGYLVHE